MANRRVTSWSDVEPVEMLPGLIRRTLGSTDDAMVTEFRAEAGVEIPAHSHPHQQIGYVASGEVAITIDGLTTHCKVGDCWSIPGGVTHSATFLTESIVVECFSPPREDYR